MSKLLEQFIPVVAEAGLNTNKNAVFGGNVTITGTLNAGTVVETSQAISSVSANAFAVGAAGATNPVLNVDASTSSVVAGLTIKGAATGGTVAVTATDSGSNTSITLDGKGTGTIGINTVSTTSGLVTIGNATSLGGVNINGALVITSASTTSLLVGPNGATNPALQVIGNVGSAATGISITAQAAANGTRLAATSSGTDEPLYVDSKGASKLFLNSKIGDGAVSIQQDQAIPAAGSVTQGLLFSSTAAFGIYYGSGAPTIAAAQGSIYLRSDGSSTSTRLYVNTTGSTTWTNVTTAA